MSPFSLSKSFEDEMGGRTYPIKLQDAVDHSVFQKEIRKMEGSLQLSRYLKWSESLCSSSKIPMERNVYKV